MGIFVVALLVAGLTTIAIDRPAGAQVVQTLEPDAEKRAAINSIHRDFFDRRATDDEMDKYLDTLGARFSTNDVRIRALASNAFKSEMTNGTREGLVRTLYRELFDRNPTDKELARDTRRLSNREGFTNLELRRELTSHLLERSGYDPDGLAIREVSFDLDEDGRIVRFEFELDADFAATDDLAITVGTRKDQRQGEMRLRAGDRLVRFIPNNPLRADGRLIGMVFLDTGDGVKIADIRTPLTDLPPRTTEPAWPDRVFEDQRIVAYYGNHLTRLLGVLGETGPEDAVGRVNAAAAPFSSPDKEGVGAFEMIVTVAQGSAGADGNFSHPSNLEDVERWIDVAEEAGLYVILDIQPGRSHFLGESQRYESLLKRPNVGLALDPEWRMGPGQIPGRVVGQVSAAEVNEVSAWLSDLVLENDLPEKIFMVHQFQSRMITNREDLIDRPGLATVIHADGFGGRAIKLATYGILQVEAPLYNGFKLFIDEDTQIFQPADVLNFTDHPVPDFISYQ